MNEAKPEPVEDAVVPHIQSSKDVPHQMRRAEDLEELEIRQRVTLPLPAGPRSKRVEDPIRRMAVNAAWDYVATRRLPLSHTDVVTMCRIYHVHLRALGGRL